MEYKPPSSTYLPALHPHFHHNTPKVLGLCLDKNVLHEIYELLHLGVTSYLTYISSWKNCRCYFGEVTEITQLFSGKPTPSGPQSLSFPAMLLCTYAKGTKANLAGVETSRGKSCTQSSVYWVSRSLFVGS